jgi:hypothetical protein
MGCILSCLRNNNKEYNDHLIRDRYCPQCKHGYLSNNEYNKHIVNCNRLYGDI